MQVNITATQYNYNTVQDADHWMIHKTKKLISYGLYMFFVFGYKVYMLMSSDNNLEGIPAKMES